MRSKRLTPARCEGAKPHRKTYTLGDGRDGHGLALRVLPTGTRTWTQRLFLDGKITNIGLGGYPAVGLDEAREAARLNWHKSKAGIDPRRPRKPKVVHPRRQRIENGTATLDDCLVETIEQRRRNQWGRSADKQAKDWLTTRRHVPELLGQPVSGIRYGQAAEAIGAIRSPIIARKVATRLALCVDWAIRRELRELANPFHAMRDELPRMPRHEPRAALAHRDVAGVLDTLREWGESRPGNASRALALEFVVLTAVRVNEAYGAEWREIQGDVWEIPAGRMKAKERHTVPLSPAALDVLRRARELGGESLVFPSPRSGTEMASSRAGEALRAIGLRCHAHGFRASFRTWCGETGVDRELAELCLAHRIGSTTEQAYLRSDYIERRRTVMSEWADYITGEY